MHSLTVTVLIRVVYLLAITTSAARAQFGRLNKNAVADEPEKKSSVFFWGKKKGPANTKQLQSASKKGNFVTDLAGDVVEFAEDIGDLAEDVIEDITEAVAANAVFAGKVRPVLRKLSCSRKQAAAIWKAIRKATQLDEAIFFAVFGWAFVPAVEYFYEFGDDKNISQAEKDSLTEPTKRDFGTTFLYHVSDHFSQFCRIGLGVLAVDVLEILLAALGFKFERLDQLSKTFAKVTYSVWAARRLKIFKTYLIATAVKRPTSDLGRAMLADHILDSVIYGLTAFFLLDWLDVELGLGIKSMLTFGSAGTLILSLASKDLAGQVINGLALTASDKIYEGEHVKFGDGLSGVIEKMGWMETTIRMDDEHTLSIGNTEMSNKRIINLSRTQQSQVHQTLRFSYADIDVLPQVLEDIKREIRAACPALIDDGSRPFHAVWSEYGSNYLEVHVEGVSVNLSYLVCLLFYR
mmetsp:Transcript_1741/g.3425  ORF Transcript_1741/g.3425 Transcript_1741/m.3425 type:complete len:464 (+) Transcript_1741:253-1644(+)